MAENLKSLAIKAHTEYKDEMENVLNLLRSAIDNDEMPKAKEILQDQIEKKTKKWHPNSIKRPPNSNIIYTNQIGKLGLLNIIREFCEKHEINKQKLVPISKNVCNILWEQLPDRYQKFFSDLSSEVKKEHKNLYPDYKFKPIRKPGNHTNFKHYEPNHDEQMEDTSDDLDLSDYSSDYNDGDPEDDGCN